MLVVKEAKDLYVRSFVKQNESTYEYNSTSAFNGSMKNIMLFSTMSK